MKQVLDKLAPSPAEERLAAARQAIAELNGPLAESARRRGGYINQRQQAYSELVSISSTTGPDNLPVDPADADPTIPPRRVALRKQIADLDLKIANEDAIRRELDPKLAEACEDLTYAEGLLVAARVKDAMQTLASGLLACRDKGVWPARIAIEAAQRKYPQHQFLKGNRTLRAHAGAPPLLGQIDTFMKMLNLLLESVATWDKSLLAPSEPAHQRATSIERAETHLSEAVVAAQKRQSELSRKAHPATPPEPPREIDMWDVVQENRDAVAAREKAS
jgi:hypothetical protein